LTVKRRDPRDRNSERIRRYNTLVPKATYLVEHEAPHADPQPPRELKTNAQCEVGDAFFASLALSDDRLNLVYTWTIISREPTEPPLAGRLTVRPGGQPSPEWTRQYG
jgi:hypothetical protein